jgi:hypothetical protein
MNQTRFQHKFVDQVPEMLECGVLYISLSFSTSIHLCACGCGNEVVTPLSADDWVVIFDGENASLYPSIGNWSFPCKSHYWIRHGSVVVAESWTESMITMNRRADFENLDGYEYTSDGEIDEITHTSKSQKNEYSLWRYIKRFICIKFRKGD